MNPQLIAQLQQSLAHLGTEIGDLRLTELERARVHAAMQQHARLVGTVIDATRQKPQSQNPADGLKAS
ncbi:hypothetical protein [Haloferula sp. A504]|uniref:hypothetical protein n=1 Tax=Haloferula sp. A504 TaxID=3373601 RepID=UPI0031C6B232|nr:hypothetical protein [Verrucomicrobiaceae bacterium E54]